MSVDITIKNLIKRFDDNTVIPDLTTFINKGELFTLLGPSGCGKTTLLRMIAGFNSIEGGVINFNDKIVNDIPPHKRNIGMVFQNYAIFPHMSVFDNVAFGLKNIKVKNPELRERVDNILNVVKIEHLKNRKPNEMSGGQQQRLALARAIVVQPDVLLMDEPLSNLDAKLRVEMREAIKEIQEKFKITTIYVTHDQEEALSISDRIAIMNEGEIQQIGTPVEIYLHPVNIFVATFIGQSVLLDAETAKKGGKYGIKLNNGVHIDIQNLNNNISEGKNVKLLVRPNEFYFSQDGHIKGEIIESFFLGVNIQYKIKLTNNQIIEVLDNDLSRQIIPNGADVELNIKPHSYNVFDSKTEKTLINRVNVNE